MTTSDRLVVRVVGGLGVVGLAFDLGGVAARVELARGGVIGTASDHGNGNRRRSPDQPVGVPPARLVLRCASCCACRRDRPVVHVDAGIAVPFGSAASPPEPNHARTS